MAPSAWTFKSHGLWLNSSSPPPPTPTPTPAPHPILLLALLLHCLPERCALMHPLREILPSAHVLPHSYNFPLKTYKGLPPDRAGSFYLFICLHWIWLLHTGFLVKLSKGYQVQCSGFVVASLVVEHRCLAHLLSSGRWALGSNMSSYWQMDLIYCTTREVPELAS